MAPAPRARRAHRHRLHPLPPSDPIPPSLGIRPEGDSLGTLWTGEGFAHHAAHPAASFVPPHIGVAHEDPTGDGRDGVFTVRTIEQATLGPGEYWAGDGPMTTDQIDDQLDCGE